MKFAICNKKLIVVAASFAIFSGVSRAQDNGALLDLLVKKKVISDQEAEEVRADLVKEYASTSAGKINLSSSITEMKISGDIRMRFLDENRDYEVAPTVTAAPAGTILPQWNGNRSPIFIPNSTNGTWFRQTNGDFAELQPGTKAYKTASGKVFVINAGATPAAGSTAVPYYNREAGQHSFYLPSSSGEYYQASNGDIVKGKAPAKATRYARYSNQTKPNEGGHQDRYRFRLRLRDEFKLAGGWFGGVELSSSSASDSGNQTFGAKDATGVGGGGFDKYGIFISKVYLGWNYSDWAQVTIGKQNNPFYTSDMVWDPDISPDGIVEQINFSKLYTGKSDGGVNEERPWELMLNMGQFIFSDNIENGLTLSEPGFATPSDVHHDYSTNAYMFEFQLQSSYKFENGMKAIFAPAVMFYNSAHVTGANNEASFTDITGPTSSSNPGGITYLDNQTRFLGETRDLTLITAPGEVDFKVMNQPVRAFWDFSYNAQGKKRTDDIYGMFYYNSSNQVTSYHATEDDIAWLLGLQVGENKKAGDFSLMANYRQVGMASVDPNLTDSDFALGRVNIQGLKATATYNFTDYATGALTYFYCVPLRDNYVGGQATQGANLSNFNNFQSLLVDIQIKF